MQAKKSNQLFTIILLWPKGREQEVKVRATTREIAERRAVKRNPNCLGVKHDV